MDKLLGLVAALALVVGPAQTTMAQQAQGNGVPVEFFACHWQDGKGIEDLKKVGKAFAAWADKSDSGYSAWVLTPQFHSGLDFDVGWLGAWPDGKAMGKSMDNWLAEGGELAADFAKVMSCGSHEMATSMRLNAPKGPPGNGLVMFSQCSMADGKMLTDAISAHQKVATMMAEMGSKHSSWVFYPGPGAGDIDFDYWQVLAFNSYAEFGAGYDMYMNGGGMKKAMAAMKNVSACKRAVVFDAHLVRAAASE